MQQHKPIRVAILGCGFWSQFQVAGWQELAGVEIVGAWNRTRSRAEALEQQRGIQRVYDTPEQMLQQARPEVVDIITDVDTHAR